MNIPTHMKHKKKKTLKTNFVKMLEEVLKKRNKALKGIKEKTNEKLKKVSKSLP